MKTVIALIIKLILTFAATWVSFAIFGDVSMTYVWIITIAATILNYLIGDLLILPRFGNWIAAICDGVLGVITAYAVLAAYTFYTATSLAVFAILIVVFELFFHMYLINSNVIKRKKSDSGSMRHKKLNYSTETAREMHPSSLKNSTYDKNTDKNNTNKD